MENSNDQATKVLSADELFDQQKAKVNIIAEIFNNKEFFLKDSLIKRDLTSKLNDEGFKWLKDRINELKTIPKMVSA